MQLDSKIVLQHSEQLRQLGGKKKNKKKTFHIKVSREPQIVHLF